MCAIAGFGHEPHTGEQWRDALIDLLTDDDAHSTTEPKLSEQSESLSDESDSREKLEDDVGFIVKEGFVTYKSIIGWLDRQAAITERKHLELACAFQLESDKRITELQEKVDALTQANADYREEWHRVCRERDDLQRKLHESNRERESLRKQLGIAIDHAHDMIALVSVDTDEGLA
jgi:hypothetical protein